MAAIALAALSARLLAEAAAREGLDAIALDLFGDRDTRQAAQQWLPLGAAGALRIDAARLLDALRVLARRGDVQGWIAGAGFDGQPELLAQGAALLPLLGTAAADQRRVRHPAGFFGWLDAHGIAHPDVRHEPATDNAGWLVKDAGGCGGWHIRRASGRGHDATAPQRYWQREAAGVPMSATFIANGRDALLLGCNEQIVRPLGERPFVFRGVLGPLPVAASVAREVGTIAQSLAAAFALRGLASFDFLLDGTRVLVLEVNPRPPASIALYPRVGDVGVLQAHLQACRQGALPAAPPPAAGVCGSEIVFAARALRLDAAAAAALASQSDTHDLPQPGACFERGDPVCSLTAHGADAAAVKLALTQRRDALLHTLEPLQ